MDGGLETKKNWISDENVINSYACQIRNDDDEYYSTKKKRFVSFFRGEKTQFNFPLGGYWKRRFGWGEKMFPLGPSGGH